MANDIVEELLICDFAVIENSGRVEAEQKPD